MGSIKYIGRSMKRRAAERLCDVLLRSRHFRRTVLRRLFQSHVSPGALAYVKFSDHALIVDPRDHMIAFSLVSGQPWQRRELDRAIEIAANANTLIPNGWLLDIGANIGTQTVYALLSGKFCGVVAIEPDPHNAELLRRNVDLNGIKDRVHVIEAAASARAGAAELIRDAENHGAHTLERGRLKHPLPPVVVPTRTVDSMLADLGIDPCEVAMAVIDVEGHELPVLEGMAQVRKQGVPIAVEVSASDTHRDFDDLRRLLAKDYALAQALRGGSTPAASEADRSLAGFDFGVRHIDVLVYNARVAATT